MTYRENIANLKRRQAINLRQRRFNSQTRINNIREQEKELIDNINEATGLLVGKDFGEADLSTGRGGIIPYKYKEYRDKEAIKGEKAAQLDREDHLSKYYGVGKGAPQEEVKKTKDHLQNVKDTDTAYLKIKRDMLLGGAYYEDGDRFQKLSPHGQAAYVASKIRLYKQSEKDKLNHWMVKEANPYPINGKDFIPSAVHIDHNLTPLVKEALLRQGIKELRKQYGIDGFSGAVLQDMQVDDYIDKNGDLQPGSSTQAIESMMGKYRKLYNINQSQTTRLQYMEEFIDNPTDPNALFRLHLAITGTHDNEDSLITNEAAWIEMEKLFVTALRNKQITEDELKNAFQNNINPAKNAKGRSYMQTHGHRYQNIIDKYEDANSSFLQSEENLIKSDAQEYANSIQKQLKNKNSELSISIQQAGGMRDQIVENIFTTYKEKLGQDDIEMPDWLSKILTIEEADQDAIVKEVKRLLKQRKYITSHDVRNATHETMAEIRQLPGYQANNAEATMSGEAFRTSMPGGEGFEKGIETGIRAHLGLEALDTLPYNMGSIQARVEADWLSIYNELLNTGKHQPATAARLALDQVQWKLGLRPGPDGTKREPEDVNEEYFTERAALGEDGVQAHLKTRVNVQQEVQAGQDFINKLDAQVKAGELPELKVFLPGKGKDSADWKSLVEFAEGKTTIIPDYYVALARLYPELAVEDIINWQLRAGDHKGLESYSSFYDALHIPGLENINRLIGYKADESSVKRAKIESIDGLLQSKQIPIVTDGVQEEGSETTDEKQIEDTRNPRTQGYDIDYPKKPEKPKAKGKGANQSAMNEYKEALQKWQLEVERLEAEQKEDRQYTERTTTKKTPLGDTRTRTATNRRGRELYNITEYLNADGEWVETKPIPDSYLQSYWNIPGSPVLSPNLQEYALELYNKSLITG